MSTIHTDWILIIPLNCVFNRLFILNTHILRLESPFKLLLNYSDKLESILAKKINLFKIIIFLTFNKLNSMIEKMPFKIIALIARESKIPFLWIGSYRFSVRYNFNNSCNFFLLKLSWHVVALITSYTVKKKKKKIRWLKEKSFKSSTEVEHRME